MSDWIADSIKRPTDSGWVLVAFTSQDLDDCCGKPPVRQVGLGQWANYGSHGEWWADSKEASFSERSETVTHWMPIPWPDLPEASS